MTDRAAGSKRLGDRALATVLGAVLFVVAAWPLFVLRVPPYQDLPDHLATTCVLLHPERFPEYGVNGLLRANALFEVVLLGLAKVVGVLAAGRVAALVTVAATALALPHFVLSFTDRRRMLVASLAMAPMVHHWWILMGMLGFALAIPIALLTLALLARQTEAASAPSGARALLVALLGLLLWYAHAIVLLMVALLAFVESLVRPEDARGKARMAAWLVGPLAPALVLTAGTILAHAGTSHDPRFGRVADVFYQDNLSAAYDLWAHWQLGMSPLSAAGLVTAVVLAFYALKNARARVPLFSRCALFVLLGLYALLPHMMPGFGYVDERVLPLIWAWALVRVPERVPRGLGALLVASSAAWAIGTACDLFRAERDLDELTSVAPDVPDVDDVADVRGGARLLTLDFAPRVSTTNTWSLLHASGMFTVLRGAHPQDVWADSPTMALSHRAPPTLVEDPVRIRDLLAAARTPAAYCASLVRAGLPDYGCEARYHSIWRGVWEEIEARYDEVVLWGAPPAFLETVPPSFTTRVERGKVRLLVKAP